MRAFFRGRLVGNGVGFGLMERNTASGKGTGVAGWG